MINKKKSLKIFESNVKDFVVAAIIDSSKNKNSKSISDVYYKPDEGRFCVGDNLRLVFKNDNDWLYIHSISVIRFEDIMKDLEQYYTLNNEEMSKFIMDLFGNYYNDEIEIRYKVFWIAKIQDWFNKNKDLTKNGN